MKMKKSIRIVARKRSDLAKARLMGKLIDHQLAEHIGRQVYNIAFAKLMFGQMPPQLDSNFYTLSSGTEDLTMKGGDTHMMKKKGMTKNQKLKTQKTSKAKKLVKATKK